MQGKRVSFDRININKYYGLPDINNDAYQEMVGKDLNRKTVKDAFCKNAATLKRYKNGGVKSFPTKALNLSFKVLHYFVAAKLSLQPISVW